MAMVISVLETDHGKKALVKSSGLIMGKMRVSSAIVIALTISFTGVILAFSLVLDGKKTLNLVGKTFVGIVCYLLSAFLLHFYLVTQAVIYFVCKSYHDEDISNVAAHLDNPYVNLVRENVEL
ncbi:hypothetical protein MKW92_036135 [Papaver armeniacum]|nr:hypothetical protein MKW92_036135 [Papaver armeniacum]